MLIRQVQYQSLFDWPLPLTARLRYWPRLGVWIHHCGCATLRCSGSM